MGLLELLLVILLILWILGFSLHVGGALSHVVLAVFLVLLIFRIARSGRIV